MECQGCCAVDERLRFVAWLSGGVKMAELR